MRYKYLIASVALLALGIGGMVVLRPPTGNTKVAVFDRIKVGMTEREVHEIIGGPPKDELNGNYYVIPDGQPEHLIAALNPDEVRQEQWISESGKITVGYDKNDLVVDKRYETIRKVGFIEWVRAWVGL